MNDAIFDKLDFGPLKPLLDDDDITDISYCNKGQIWIRSLTQGSKRVEVAGLNDEFMERLAFQCSNVMGTTFNNAKPFLDAESTELRLNFVHDSIATNGLACVIRKTPAKIRLEKEKLLKDDYFTANIHDILIKCVEGHCNIIVCGETGSGKTEFVKYLASHTKENEKIITIEDTLELHLDRIFPHRDIVAMKTNNVASYSDVLVTCMRQNPKWILLSEVRSAEAVTAVRNSISSGHNILSTIHADKASAIPYRLYSLLESDIEVDQFLNTIYRYIQIGVHIKAYYSRERGKFHREVDEVVEFYVDDNNQPQSHILYQKTFGKAPVQNVPSDHLREYLENQNISIDNLLASGDSMEEVDTKLEEVERASALSSKEELPAVELPAIPISSIAPPTTSVPTNMDVDANTKGTVDNSVLSIQGDQKPSMVQPVTPLPTVGSNPVSSTLPQEKESTNQVSLEQQVGVPTPPKEQMPTNGGATVSNGLAEVAVGTIPTIPLPQINPVVGAPIPNSGAGLVTVLPNQDISNMN